MLWIIIAVVVVIVLRFIWTTHTHPAQLLCRQGAHMGWVYSRAIDDESGDRCTCLTRGSMEAMISYRQHNVHLIRPRREAPFEDFVELERWIAEKESSSEVQETLSAYSELRRELRCISVYVGAAINEIDRDVLAQIRDSDRTVVSIRENGISPRNLALILIRNVSQSRLAAGSMHVYRGTLSGVGKGMYAIWLRAVDELMAAGLAPAEETREDKENMQSAIRQMG